MLQTSRQGFSLPKNPVRVPQDAPLEKVVGATRFEGARDGAHFVLGGDGTRFVPHLEAKKWGGEAWLRLWHPDVDLIGPGDTQRMRTVAGKGAEVEVTVSKAGRIHRFSDDAQKWEIVYLTMDALPKDGIERFYLDCPEGVRWLYQPPLTQEEIAQGANRPDDVVGSYAGYFNKCGGYLRGKEEIVNYGTGKFAHLFRKKIIAADGAWLWLDQEIIGNEIQVQLPPRTWFEVHKGPWVLDPTIGYTTAGGTSFQVYSNRYFWTAPPAPLTGGIVAALYAYVWKSSLTKALNLGLYTVTPDTGNLAYNASRVAAQTLSFSGSGTGWVYGVIATPDKNIVAGTNNYGFLFSNANNYPLVYFDADATKTAGYESGVTALDAEISGSYTDLGGRIFSMYATYDELIAVGGTTTINWNTLQSVVDAIEIDWNTLQSVGGAKEFKWGVANLVNGVSDQRWNVASLVAGQPRLRWHILSTISNQGSFKWAVTSTVGSQVSFEWITKALASGIVNPRWTIRALVADVLDAGWHVMETVGVSREYLWGVATLVAKQVTLDWQTRALAGKELSVDWNTLSLVADATTLEWHTLSVVGDELHLVWKWKYASRLPAKTVVVIPRRVLQTLRMPRRDKAVLIVPPEASSKTEN